MTDLPAFDATALALLGHDVALIPDAAMKNPTPCDGWTVTDLINHMNEEHEAIACTELPPIEVTGDPRDAFARIAARCLAAFERAARPWTCRGTARSRPRRSSVSMGSTCSSTAGTSRAP